MSKLKGENMKKMITALTLLIAFTSFGSTTNVSIVNLEYPRAKSEPYLVYGANGEIYEVDQSESSLVELLREAVESRKVIEVELEDFSLASDFIGARSRILSVTLTSTTALVPTFMTTGIINKSINYDPSVLMSDYISDVGSRQNATNIFYTMRQDTKSKSQCYNRAHVWSWEMYNQHTINGRRVQAGKIWMFFTKKYIREYNYKWWFHISPYLKSNGKELIMDRKFSRAPLTERQWTDTFIQSRTHCPRVTRYSDQSNNQYSGHCFVMKTSVHYWQPWNIEKAESQEGFIKSNWSPGEVQSAYNDAVKGYGGWFNRRTAPYL